MKPTIDDLHDYVLDLLPNAERRKIDAELARSPELAAEVRAAREALAKSTEIAGLAKPRPEARNRLLSALSTGERFAPFMQDLARDFDLSVERIRELCGLVDQPSSWEAGPLPGIFVMHFAGGPNVIAPDTGFVRLPAGLAFPYHRHVGHEINYVMEGAVRDGDGSLYLPGEAIVMTPGTEHEFSIPSDRDALIAVVQAGFDFVPKPA